MPPEESVSKSLLDKPLQQLTEDDISQLTREDCRRYLKLKGMRRPSWNKSQAIQQVQRGKNTDEEFIELAEETVPDGRTLQDKADLSGDASPTLVAAIDKSAPSRTIGSVDTSAGQMTIFYSGKVNVYDDVPADKATNIMCVASSSLCVPSETPLNATVAARHSTCCLQLATTKLRPISDMVLLPTIQTEAVENPSSRKASVQRYLEKRKDRLSSAPTPSGPIEETIQMNATFF
uniref:Protein TIFY n=1 Tax=Nicotiana tabacum TaxID=4097 RepID=T1WP61_TOBAC|nr:jasmonate ZIM-domain protein 6 [Nicotiana tabacum]